MSYPKGEPVVALNTIVDGNRYVAKRGRHGRTLEPFNPENPKNIKIDWGEGEDPYISVCYEFNRHFVFLDPCKNNGKARYTKAFILPNPISS